MSKVRWEFIRNLKSIFFCRSRDFIDCWLCSLVFLSVSRASWGRRSGTWCCAALRLCSSSTRLRSFTRASSMPLNPTWITMTTWMASATAEPSSSSSGRFIYYILSCLLKLGQMLNVLHLWPRFSGSSSVMKDVSPSASISPLYGFFMFSISHVWFLLTVNLFSQI